MISTLAQEADRTRAYAAGANVYVVKPVDPAELVAYSQLLTGQAISREISA
jgi:two-component system chemotaxis response regulator CheY